MSGEPLWFLRRSFVWFSLRMALAIAWTGHAAWLRRSDSGRSAWASRVETRLSIKRRDGFVNEVWNSRNRRVEHELKLGRVSTSVHIDQLGPKIRVVAGQHRQDVQD